MSVTEISHHNENNINTIVHDTDNYIYYYYEMSVSLNWYFQYFYKKFTNNLLICEQLNWTNIHSEYRWCKINSTWINYCASAMVVFVFITTLECKRLYIYIYIYIYIEYKDSVQHRFRVFIWFMLVEMFV
jgi:hypothetical protein